MKKTYKFLLRHIGSHLPDPSEWGGNFKICQKIRNRWARKIAPGISNKANICRGARILGDGENLIIEEHSPIGINCKVGSNLFIGKHTMMAPNCTILTENHVFDKETMQFEGEETKHVSIGHHCWIGERVMILPGARIGNYCIIGAGSVVPGKDYPDYSLIAGNPASIRKSIEH